MARLAAAMFLMVVGAAMATPAVPDVAAMATLVGDQTAAEADQATKSIEYQSAAQAAITNARNSAAAKVAHVGAQERYQQLANGVEKATKDSAAAEALKTESEAAAEATATKTQEETDARAAGLEKSQLAGQAKATAEHASQEYQRKKLLRMKAEQTVQKLSEELSEAKTRQSTAGMAKSTQTVNEKLAAQGATDAGTAESSATGASAGHKAKLDASREALNGCHTDLEPLQAEAAKAVAAQEQAVKAFWAAQANEKAEKIEHMAAEHTASHSLKMSEKLGEAAQALADKAAETAAVAEG